MVDIQILYATMTGHSKRIAHAIGKELGIKSSSIKENPVINTKLLFIVGGIYGGESMPELVSFVKQLERNQVEKVILITSCASKTQGQQKLKDILAEKQIKVLDEKIYQGSFLLWKIGHPNRQDINEAIEYSKRIKQEELV